MAKGLLLGNGINACIGIKDLSVKCIAERFMKNIAVYTVITQAIFGVQIEDDFLYGLKKPYELGIEVLAGELYKYVKERKRDVWTDNDEYRLQDLITCICITSIFYDENGKISQKYDQNNLPQMNKYEKLYTLNYIEFWDGEHKCIHLHGNVELSKLSNDKNAILVSAGRMNLSDYAKSVAHIKEKYSVIEFYPNDIIFAPSEIEKQKLICVTGIFPSNKLYPAEDLFLYNPKELYKDLDMVEELDVFGMSPYGDKDIIDKINRKKKVRIYVYNKNENLETQEWEKKLTCNYELIDSRDME